MKPCLHFLALLTIASCKPADDDNTAGKGGSGVLRITPLHHTTPIRNARVYIKYNASDAPASFDDSTTTVQIGGKPVATFAGMKEGRYYLYGKGYDSLISENVEGGLPYHLHSSDTQAVDLLVTEDGH
jgi:hypothetical protein